MVSEFSVMVWVCLGLLSSGMAEYNPETSPLLLSHGKQIIGGLQPSSGSREKKWQINQRLLAVETDLLNTKAVVQATETRLQTVEAKLQLIERQLQSSSAPLNASGKGGSTFVRWGRKGCSNQTELVYAGVAGGSSWLHTGSGANRLCLPMKPQFDDSTLPSYYGYMYGAEYQFIPGHNNQDVPCSVCRTTKSTTIMVPATQTCPTGWTTQYTGHLATQHYGNKAASEYVCLDGEPEDAVSGDKNENGNLFYYTVTQCGSLPCPPYINNRVVVCAVCSK